MIVNGKPTRTIWPSSGSLSDGIEVIDQRRLPHRYETLRLNTVEQVAWAISDMIIRGAGLIGATAGFGMAIATREARDECFDADLKSFADQLVKTRPTASNLAWAVNRQLEVIATVKALEEKRALAWGEAQAIADEDALACRDLGQHGLELIRAIAKKKADQGLDEPVRILTHCNAGWLAFVDHGSATGPIYAAHDEGIAVEVWVDETRPRNQGASLTAWELGQHGVTHRLIVDNAGGHLMQHGQVDMVIVGTDRVTRQGDVANKIGTYLKALAAKDNDLPFYVALPSSTFDMNVRDGIKEIPIEERSDDEVLFMEGLDDSGNISRVRICPEITTASNYGFDVTPARLVTGFITERGVCSASEAGIVELFPEFKS
jgi:methylthioribose-1-phosphate isomerase